MRAYWKLTQSGLRAFVRDRQGVFWSFFFPLFFIFIFGSLFGGRDRQTKFAIGLIIPSDLPPNLAWIPTVFKEKVPVLETHTGALEAELKALGEGKRRAVVVFPADTARRIEAGETVDVKIHYDPSQQQTAPIVTNIVQNVIAGMDKNLSQSPTLLQVKQEPLLPAAAKKLNPRGIDFLLPGLLAMTIMQLGLFTAIPLITMREKGILKRLRATPLPRKTVVASQVTQRLVIGVVQTLTILAIGRSFYKFQVIGSWAALFGLVVFGVLTFIAIGAVLSAIAKTQESGVSLVQLVNFPMMFLSGIFFPTEMMPASLRPITNALPATYLADALRHTMIATPSAFSLPVDLAVLGGWLIVGLFLASRMFRWE